MKHETNLHLPDRDDGDGRGAAVMCVTAKDYKKAVYWIAAAVLNACVTF